MKQCPVCKTTYTDDSLQFCLADGTVLFLESDEVPTQIISANQPPIRVNLAQSTSPAFVAGPTEPQTQPPIAKKAGSGIIIAVLIFVLALVVLGSAGVIGWLLLRDRGTTESSSSKNLNSGTNTTKSLNLSVSPTPDEKTTLNEKISNLEKQMQEQRNKKNNVPTISNSTPLTPRVTARVNSPGDGFLALRSAPSSETGERIMQIPHGAIVTVFACQSSSAGKKGRWCRVDYNGNFGWAFDGFLIY